jgi:integrase
MALTAKKIENAKPGPKPQRLWDSCGLYIEVAPTGGKWWRWKYRFGGKEKRLSFGTFPDVSLSEARGHRDVARKLLKAGTDPSADRQEEKKRERLAEANGFEAIAREWYEKRSGVWVPSHAADVLRRLESNLFRELGDKPIGSITAPQLLAAVRKIEARGAHDLAHRVLQVASQVFRYGVATGRCERDPVPDLRGALTPHKPRNQPAVKPEELPGLMRAIDGYHNIGDVQTKLALCLLALTFVRTNELIGAQWSEFSLDEDAPTWTVPAERMKMKMAHIVPLSQQAVAALRELRAMARDSIFVFPGRNRDRPISNNTLLFALYRLGYKGKMTGHGFRAVASSLLNEAGYRGDVIERQLAHKEPNESRGAYNRAEYLPERRKMMQRWANLLNNLKSEEKMINRNGARNEPEHVTHRRS